MLGMAALLSTAGPVRAAAGAVNIETPPKSAPQRKPPANLARLPAPKASGPLRILLVDDDASANNQAAPVRKGPSSDEIYRALVAATVDGKADAWSVEVVKFRANGPALERLRDFNVIVWYTGDAYGTDNETIGLEDQNLLRRYLQEVGGVVILISPGFVNNIVYGQKWESTDQPFLREVLGVDGCYGLAQRFTSGVVRAHDGTQLEVVEPGVVETQFSAVNSNGAALVFTSPLKSPYISAQGEVPVAVANAYGAGRIVYVGFSFENIPESERAKAFGILLGAGRGAVPSSPSTSVAVIPGGSGAGPMAVAPVAAGTGAPQTLRPVQPGPAPTSLIVRAKEGMRHEILWNFVVADGAREFVISRRDAGIWTYLYTVPPSRGRVANKSGIETMTAGDFAVVAPNSAYMVVAIYPDGREGEATVEYPNPPQPVRPAGLLARQVGPDSVLLEWTLIPDRTWYFVQGPGQPDEGQRYSPVKRGTSVWLQLEGVPTGVHEYRVAADYRDRHPSIDHYYTPANYTPLWASVAVGVNTALPVSPTPPPIPPPPTASSAGPRPVAAGDGNRIQTPTSLQPVQPGPPATQLTVTSTTPYAHPLSWTNPAGVKNTDVWRKTGEQWSEVAMALPAATTTITDAAFLMPGTVYRVVSRYPDGRMGEAEVTHPNPKQPAVAANLKVTQTGERAVRLNWLNPADVSGLEGYRIFAQGLPRDGVDVPRTPTAVTLPNVPENRLQFVVTARYAGNALAPVNATADGIIAHWRGQYRLALLGFRVERRTVEDDIFDGDGRGDEVFFGAYRATSRWNGQDQRLETIPLGVVQSVVMGDDNSRPSRQRVGTAGPTGGIRSGDIIPSASAVTAQPGLVVSSDRLPLLLWEGDMSNDDQPVIVAFSAFEWDNDSPENWNAWQNYWSSAHGATTMRASGRDLLNSAPTEVRYGPLVPVNNGIYPTLTFFGRPIGTRPIGALKSTSIDGDIWSYVPHGFALVRSNLEQVLGNGSVTVIEASLATRRSPGVDNPTEQDEARYVAYVQIQRLSPTPVKGDAPPPIAAVPTPPSYDNVVPKKSSNPKGGKFGKK